METFTVDHITDVLRKEGIPEKILDILAGKRSQTNTLYFSCFLLYVLVYKCKKTIKIVKRSRDGGAKSMHTRMCVGMININC